MWTVRVAVPLAVAAGLALVGCAVEARVGMAPPSAESDPPAAAPPVAAGRFEDVQGRFGIVPPPGWTVDTSGRHGLTVVFADPNPPAPDRFVANLYVVVRRATSRLDLPPVVDAHLRELARMFPDHRIITDVAATLPDGTPARLISATYTDPDVGLVLRILQMLTVHEDVVLDVTATSLREDWEIYEPLFDSSLRSVTVGT